MKPGDHDEYVKLIEQVNLDLNRAAVPGKILELERDEIPWLSLFTQAYSWLMLFLLVRPCFAFTGRDLLTRTVTVRFVPIWFPGVGWKRELNRMKATLAEVLTKPINYVKDQMVCLQFISNAVSSLIAFI